MEPVVTLIERGHASATGGGVDVPGGGIGAEGKLPTPALAAKGQGARAVPGKGPAQEGRRTSVRVRGPAPWGEGRPGWHIECSAMAEAILGLDFEIHGGGSDLVFPHHENEIAQTEAGRGRPLARIWMHNGMLQLEREKMSKSVGNITSLSEAIDAVGPEVLKMYFVGAHYRSPMPYNEAELDQARSRVERIRD